MAYVGNFLGTEYANTNNVTVTGDFILTTKFTLSAGGSTPTIQRRKR